MLPDPPIVEFNEITREVDIKFDADYEFTVEAAERISARMLETFPPRHLMDDRTLDAMREMAAYLQLEAYQRGELTLRDPLKWAAKRAEALRRLKEMPPITESVLAAPLEETEDDDGHEPGEVIVELHCPCCGAALSIEYGDEPGEIVAVGEEVPDEDKDEA